MKVDGPRVWVGTEDGLALIDKPTGKVVRTWQEKDGLPFKVVTAIDVDPKTGDVWLGLFGGGLARLSGGRFDHWHQLNSGLVNDVVYGVAVENDNVWAATTAGASRLNTLTGEWTVFTEKNAPMEEIWNYGAAYDGKDKVYLAVWGSGLLEYDIRTGRWKEYLDPDGEMEIDLYRDDGINHVIVTGASPVERRGVGLDLLRRLPLRRAALARLRPAGGRPARPTSTTTSRRAARRKRSTAPTRASASSPTRPARRDVGDLHARSRDRARTRQGHRGRQGGRERSTCRWACRTAS